jgi:hypothetical protein
MACSSMRTTKCMNVVIRELCHHLSLKSCICDVVLNFQLILLPPPIAPISQSSPLPLSYLICTSILRFRFSSSIRS